MPELPEVETVRRGLEKWCVGRTITGVEILHPRATNPKSLAALSELNSAQISQLSRRGKYLWFHLDRPYALVAHLGMSGQFRIQDSGTSDEKHLRARFTLDNNQELRFIDQRTFGWLALSGFDESVPVLVEQIAPDIFDAAFNRKELKAKIREKRSEIKRVLLDQSVMSGVGNIYADESLWRAKINPSTPCNEITPSKLEALLKAVESVMSKALVEGGTSFDSLYINVNGESGYFEHSLEAYGRTNQPCSRCGTPIERKVIAARSSHFCPNCQR
jgi:formamidopyrimidine-DNA glycosylase